MKNREIKTLAILQKKKSGCTRYDFAKHVWEGVDYRASIRELRKSHIIIKVNEHDELCGGVTIGRYIYKGKI